MRHHPLVAALAVAAAALPAAPGWAGFAGTELFVPAVARTAGVVPSQWYSTLWVTNMSSAQAVDVTMTFLKINQSNTAPKSYADTLQPGATKRYDNPVQTLFGEGATSGTVRLVASGLIAASSRTFDQPTGSTERDSKGHFFAGVPPTFAMGLGETTLVQGVSHQGSGGTFRFNFGMVETTGSSAKVKVTLRGAASLVAATKEYALRAFEHRQVAISDIKSGLTTDVGVIEATVTEGKGKVLLYGTLIPNGSQDSAGFEMIYPAGVLTANQESSSGGVASNAATVAEAVVDHAYAVAGTIALAGAYDEQTGWWTVSLDLENGRSADAQVQFKNGDGDVQKLYNPATTTTILTRGQATGTQGAVTFDLTIGGVNAGADDLTADGAGDASYEGVSGSYAVDGLVLPKTIGAYPTSGTITLVVGAAEISVTFDGTRYAQGEYTVGRITRTFTIDLETGEVSWA